MTYNNYDSMKEKNQTTLTSINLPGPGIKSSRRIVWILELFFSLTWGPCKDYSSFYIPQVFELTHKLRNPFFGTVSV